MPVTLIAEESYGAWGSWIRSSTAGCVWQDTRAKMPHFQLLGVVSAGRANRVCGKPNTCVRTSSRSASLLTCPDKDVVIVTTCMVLIAMGMLCCVIRWGLSFLLDSLVGVDINMQKNITFFYMFCSPSFKWTVKVTVLVVLTGVLPTFPGPKTCGR